MGRERALVDRHEDVFAEASGETRALRSDGHVSAQRLTGLLGLGCLSQ